MIVKVGCSNSGWYQVLEKFVLSDERLDAYSFYKIADALIIMYKLILKDRSIDDIYNSNSNNESGAVEDVVKHLKGRMDYESFRASIPPRAKLCGMCIGGNDTSRCPHYCSCVNNKIWSIWVCSKFEFDENNHIKKLVKKDFQLL
jgi:hypothetical protein